jgi:hypothetical protein
MQVLRTTYKCLFLLLCGLFLSAKTPPNREYQVKAVFLFNFTQFVEWPATTFSDAKAPIVIGILGEDPFGSYLNETVSGEVVNGHPLAIEHYRTVQEIKTCHILFINIEKNKIDQAMEATRGRNILTVSDVPGFIQHGGIVRFFNENNKIQFQINQEAARTNGLTISSKLLRLAKTAD